MITENYLSNVIHLYKLPVVPCLVSCQTAVWSVGMLTSHLGSSEAAKPQIALQMGPAGLSGPSHRAESLDELKAPAQSTVCVLTVIRNLRSKVWTPLQLGVD